MSTYAFAGYGVPETFIVNGKRVLACRLEVMFTAANLGFDGRFSEKTPRPHKSSFYEEHGIHHWVDWYFVKGKPMMVLYEGTLPNEKAGYPFVWETEFDKYLKKVEID